MKRTYIADNFRGAPTVITTIFVNETELPRPVGIQLSQYHFILVRV